MEIYIDLFFLFNTIMDGIIITSVSILLRRKTNIIRIILSSMVGGIISLFLFSSLNKVFIEIISVFIMSIIAFRFVNLRYTIKNIFYIYILSILLGGLLYLFNMKVSTNVVFSYIIMIIISIEVMVLYIKEIKKMKNTYNNYYKVIICFKDDDKIVLTGFMDSGNNLYDPYKKRPIILVSKKYGREENFILVPYYTASGEGLLKCVKPKYVIIDEKYYNDILVGFSDSVSIIDGIDVILHKELMKG